MNIKILFFLVFISSIANSHEVKIENKSIEEIVKHRMSKMNKIKAYSTKMYPLTMSVEFDEINEVNKELLHALKEFKILFPESSQGVARLHL